MKEIRSKWTVLVLWVAVIVVFWLIGEAVGWKRRNAPAAPAESRVLLALVGLVGVLFWAFNSRRES